MLNDLRRLASRLLVLAIYIGLAFAGIVLLVWGFVFALAVAGGLLLLFMLMRVFGVIRPRQTVRRSAQEPAQAEKPAGVIDLERRDDGSFE